MQTYMPKTLNMLKLRGSSLWYPSFASAASALGSVADALLPAPVMLTFLFSDSMTTAALDILADNALRRRLPKYYYNSTTVSKEGSKIRGTENGEILKEYGDTPTKYYQARE
jgi:hypothetical protein